jgi:FtsX-like permease family
VDRFLTTELSFPASEVAKIRELDGAEDAAAGLTVTAVHIKGRVPEGGGPAGAALHGGNFDVASVTVSAADVRKPGLATVTPGQITRGGYLSKTPRQAGGEAVVDLGYARQNDIGVGDKLTVAGEEFEVVGLARPTRRRRVRRLPRAPTAPAALEPRGRANEIQVRADAADAVSGLARRITKQLQGAEVVTAADLADRVGGSLHDAEKLSSKLGTALAIVALLAAFLIATLLTLSSVQKRIRELGTLKALGWRQRLVVRQVTGESLMQGALGGVLGAAIGIAGATVIEAIGPTLEASVEAQSTGTFDPFGQGDVAAASTDVVLGAPVDPGLVVLAIGLAIVGGLLAGAAGGLRAARLRPADALRSAE